MNELKLFQSSEFGKIRALEVNNQPYFVGRDVAIALGYSNPVSAISQHVDNEDSAKHAIPDNQGFKQSTTIINESGVYSLVFGSKLPTAKAFKRWVTSEVLPAIRTTGGYISTKQEDTPEEIMARALTIAQATLAKREERLKQLETENAQKQIIIERKDEEISIKDDTIKVLAPKGKCYDEIMSSEGLVTTNMIAAFLGVSAIKLNKLLCEWGVQYRQSSVYFLTAKYRIKDLPNMPPTLIWITEYRNQENICIGPNQAESLSLNCSIPNSRHNISYNHKVIINPKGRFIRSGVTLP